MIVAYLMGEATEEEQAALTRWRSSRPDNEGEFKRQQYVWDRLGELTNGGAMRGEAPVRKVVEEDDRIAERRITGSLGIPIRSRPVLMAAAVLLILFAIWTPSRPQGSVLGAEDIVTGTNEVVTLTLRDGTVVRLGPESRLSFSKVAGPRDVLLEGKAYFAVPHTDENAFHVHTGVGNVRVLGTRFEVEAREGSAQVLVVEGEVEAGLPDNRVSIRRGQMGRFDEVAPPVLAPVENVYLATAWIGAFGAFESTPLTDVVSEMESRFGLNIEITDEVLASRTVSGLFINQEPDEMVTNICLAVNAGCSRAGETIQMWLTRTASHL